MNLQQAIESFNDYDLTEALKNDDPQEIISQIADSNVDIYTSELLEWVGQSENYQFVEDGIEEFGFPTDDNGKPNFIQAIRQGQYFANEDILYHAWREIKRRYSNTQYKFE